MPLDILQCTGQASTIKNYPAHNVSRAGVSNRDFDPAVLQRKLRRFTPLLHVLKGILIPDGGGS